MWFKDYKEREAKSCKTSIPAVGREPRLQDKEAVVTALSWLVDVGRSAVADGL